METRNLSFFEAEGAKKQIETIHILKDGKAQSLTIEEIKNYRTLE